MSLVTRGMGNTNGLAVFGFGAQTLDIVVQPPDSADGGGRGQDQVKADFGVVPNQIYITGQATPTPAITLSSIERDKEKNARQVADRPIQLKVDGDKFAVVRGAIPTAAQAVRSLGKRPLQKKIEAVQKELGIEKEAARKKLVERAAKELQAAQRMQKELFADDEDFLLLIALADDD